jgi:hypothetical protein
MVVLPPILVRSLQRLPGAAGCRIKSNQGWLGFEREVATGNTYSLLHRTDCERCRSRAKTGLAAKIHGAPSERPDLHRSAGILITAVSRKVSQGERSQQSYPKHTLYDNQLSLVLRSDCKAVMSAGFTR